MLLMQIKGMQKEFAKILRWKIKDHIMICCSKQYIILSWCIWDTFRNLCLKIYEFDPVKCLSISGLTWQSSFKKKDKVNIHLLTDIDILLVEEKRISWRICHSTYWYAKANNTWTIMMKIKNRHISKIWV